MSDEESTRPTAVLQDSVEDKVCRICLQDDDAEQMIAPCLCKGSSRWVHRDCLDQWRVHERDRAFSQCTECHFVYHMQAQSRHQNAATETAQNRAARWRRIKFVMLVSRDVLVVTVLLQAAIGFLGWLVWLMDPDGKIVSALSGDACTTTGSVNSTVDNFWCNHEWSAYYLCGFLFLLVLLGCYGSIALCCHGCNMEATIPVELRRQQQNVVEPLETPPMAVTPHRRMESRTIQHEYSERELRRAARYRRARQRRSERCCDRCCYGNCCSGPSGTTTIDPNCCNCCCMCDSNSVPDATGSGVGGGGNDCDCDCNGDAIHIVLIIILVLVVALAVIGFFIGLVLAVVVLQRIVQRHITLLHKRRLAMEFVVQDLSPYDPRSLRPAEPLAEEFSQKFQVENWPDDGIGSLPPPIPPPKLHSSDVKHLQSLGLMEFSE